MYNGTKYNIIIVLLAAVALPLNLANAQFYQFNNSSNNTTSGSPQTIVAVPGGTVTFSLQMVLPEGFETGSVDYWLAQASGPATGVFSITGRDFTGSEFYLANPGNAVVTSSSDNRSNSMIGPSGPDGIPDNLLSPRNGYDVGSRGENPPYTNGTFQIANFTLSLSASAPEGIYQIRSFDYPGFGINDVTPTAQAALNIEVVPEPATWSLIALGGIAAFGVNVLRARRSRLSSKANV